jgi:N utilization substance protein B
MSRKEKPIPSNRHKARELALQVLFHVDLGKADPDTALFQAFARQGTGDGAVGPLAEQDATYARDLVLGTWERKEALDELIGRYAKDWSVDRLAAVDRNILRLALYEILHQSEVPDAVVADEAVELAKAYSTAESGRFINGILGAIIRAEVQVGADGPAVSE